MQFTTVAKALAAASLFHAASAQVVDVVYATEVVTVTVDGPAPPAATSAAAPDQHNWNGGWHHWSSTSTSESAPETTPEVVYTPPPTTVAPVSTTPTPTPSSTPVTTTSTESSAASYPSATSSVAAALLNSTNTFRSMYEANPVVWNDTLATFAESWADRCVFEHSGGPYGENIAAAWPSLSATDGVDMWGNEESEYDWASATFSEDTGHFTQLVWESTTDIGCALVSCTNSAGINNGDFLVCEYYPAGNVIGYFAENVKKAGVSKRGVLGLAGKSHLGRMYE